MPEANREDIVREIEKHRQAIEELQARLTGIASPADKPWPPGGFYTTYYVVAGIMLGLMGAATSFIFNVAGSRLVHQDTMQILRVFGTVFIGEEALKTQDLTFLMLVLVVHFSVGALAGAFFNVIANRFFQDRSLVFKLALGAGFGFALWIFNFYLVLSWLQPMLVGGSFVLQMIPVAVAILTHVVYGVTLGALQPISKFIAYQPATS